MTYTANNTNTYLPNGTKIMANLKATSFDGLARILNRKSATLNTQAKIGNNTTAEFDSVDNGPTTILVRLHGHPIVRLYYGGRTDYTLAGYGTVTTRERVNQFLPAGRAVIQRNHVQMAMQGRDADPIEIDADEWYTWN